MSSSLMVKLKPTNERKRSISEIMDEVRTKTADMAGAEISVSASGGGISSGTPISIEIKGSDLTILQELPQQSIEKKAMNIT